jgi:hypothetical protein
MRKRQSGLKRLAASYKRKATKSGHELAYMLMWGEEVPKGRKTMHKRYK